MIASDHSIPAVVLIVMMVVSVLVYPQHALDAANYATGHPADSTAHDSADRSGCILAGAGVKVHQVELATNCLRGRRGKRS